MENKFEFDYFHEYESEQFSFYRIPKLLFTDEYFKKLSCDAKVLYGLMLDRMCLSLKNHWVDSEKRVYIIFTIEQVTEYLNCGRDKAMKILAELDTKKGIGLIDRVKQGFGKPDAIYVKNFIAKPKQQPGDSELGNGEESDENPEDRGRQPEQREGEMAECVENKKVQAEKNGYLPKKSGGDDYKHVPKEPESIAERRGNFWEEAEASLVDAVLHECESAGGSEKGVMGGSGSGFTRVSGYPILGAGEADLPQSESPIYRSREKRLVEVGKNDFMQSDHPTSRGRESPPVTVGKTDPNYTDINNTDMSDTDLINQSTRECVRAEPMPDVIDGMDAITTYTNIIKKNVEYDTLIFDAKSDSDKMQIDMIVSLMAETIAVKRETVTIAKAEYPYPYVVNKLLRVGQNHVQYILWCLSKQTGKIWNIKAYVLACIFNAPTMIDAYYQAEVSHDMYGQ
ncbi:MAG: replication initiator protein A [Lachnospiraceae bacterium]|nr:replication initiator protein A [Lachnospiraceae bacterium]